jgi:hypothetical protein
MSHKKKNFISSCKDNINIQENKIHCIQPQKVVKKQNSKARSGEDLQFQVIISKNHSYVS